MTASYGTGQWICCSWEDVDTSNLPREPGIVKNQVLFIPPPIADATFHYGLWNLVNDRFGTLFDMWEKESVSLELNYNLIIVINSFINKVQSGKEDALSFVAATRITPNPGPLITNVLVADVVYWLKELCNFLESAFQHKKNVLIAIG
jgi:hypothetical protein